MGDDREESYLGDLIGHGVTEEERYGGILANIEKTGEKWNRERIGIYGRAIVTNLPQSASQYDERPRRSSERSCGKEQEREW